MKKNPIFNFTKALVNIHYFFTIVGTILIILYSFFKETKIPQKDGKLLNLKGNYIDIKADWDVPKDFSYKNNDKFSPDYYLEKNKEAGMLHLKANKKVAIFIIIQNLVTFILYIFIAYFLKEIFNSTNQNSAFTIKNAHRIRNIGLLLMIGGLLNLMHGYVLSDYVREIIMEFGKIKFQTSFSIFNFQSSFYLGLLVLALSQVYKRGVELQKENELTV